ncbi:MAG: DNA repair protein RecN [Nitriliruptoraceae bacterium]
MIEELHIRGLGVIESATLRLAPGLTVVTGETGAGKTMLVTALELLLGARSDTNLVRTGTSGVLVEAVIDPAPEQALPWLDNPGDPLIVSREIPVDGRSRARVGGRLVPAATLAELLGTQVEVHAQHEHVRLARPDVQRALLDRYAGDVHQRTVDRYRHQHTEWRALVDRRDQIVSDAQARARELDRLRFEVREIDGAKVDPAVDGDIDRELQVLEHADELRLAVALAAEALDSEHAGQVLGEAVAAMRRVEVDDPHLDELRQRLDAAVADVTELSTDLRDHADGIEADPRRLAELQERRHLLGTLMRKYGDDLATVLAYSAEAHERIEALEAEEADAGELDERIDALRSELESLAADVHRGRDAAGEHLAGEVDGHLADLGMPHARVTVEVEALTDTLYADGADRVTFLLAANPGEPARPIARAASGGERSRVSLAIEVALAGVDDARVLVFDEVDAGIGGATAMAVGEKLAMLAHGDGDDRRQVLCVTHLAQLAAFADVHHVVEKGVADGRTVTTSRQIAEDDRVGELSRMLGGDASAVEGREHARSLLDQAIARRAG